jgi:hypothetical protein
MYKSELEEHREELAAIETDLEKFALSKWSIAHLEGRISDLDSMIAQDEYWEKQNA